MKLKNAVLLRKAVRFQSGRLVTTLEKQMVKVLAVAGRYAMVKFPRCYPFVVNAKALTFNKAGGVDGKRAV